MAARKPAARAAVEVPAEGFMGQVFGIRHLSAAGAAHLERLLAQVDPTAVLIEGPADATHLIEHFLHKKTRPPIAVLAFTRKPPVRSILFPLAAYSPEWAAATWAARNKRLVRFMDLPASVFLGLEARAAEAPPPPSPEGEGEGLPEAGAAKPKNDTQRYLDDPWEEIPKLTGDPDYLKANGMSVRHVDLREKAPRGKKATNEAAL